MSDAPRPRTLKDSLAAARIEEMQRREGPHRSWWENALGWLGRGLLLILVVAPPWMFGAVQTRAQWQIALILMIVLAIWWIELAWSRHRRVTLPHGLLFVSLGGLLGLLQTVALPETLAKLLAGQQTTWYQETLRSFFPADRPVPIYLSLDPEATWEQLRLLLLGAVALILGSQFFKRNSDAVVLLTAMTVNGVALALFSIFQKLTDNGKVYWIFAPEFGGSPFGPFVNRNNSAGYLLLCLAGAIGLLTYLWPQAGQGGPGILVSREIPFWRQFKEHLVLLLAELTATKLAVVFAMIAIAAGVVSGLSRGGVSAMLLGSLITLVIFGMARKPKAGALLIVPVLLGVFLLTSWIGFYDQLMERFNMVELNEEDSRLRSWSETAASVGQMGWFGSGLGSYPSVHRMYSSLRETGIFEFAENQYVQSLIDAGVPGFLLLCAATLWFVYGATFILYRGSSPLSVSLGVMGVFLGTTQLIASLFDFGWYVPSNTILLAICVGFVSYHVHSFAGRLKKRSLLQWQYPRWLAATWGLGGFSLCLMAVFSYRGLADSERDLKPYYRAAQWEVAELDLTATEALLEKFSSRVSDGSSAADLLLMGDLWLRRSRLVFHRELIKQTGVSVTDTKRIADLWSLTKLDQIHETVCFLRTTKGNSMVNEFREQAFVKECLPMAAKYLAASLRRKPLQPATLLKLAQILSILDNPTLGTHLVDQAVKMSPNNINYRITASMTLLYNGQREASLPHLRRILELDPSQFARVLIFVQGLSGRLSQPLSQEIISEKILPDDPKLIYDFVIKYLADDSELRAPLLTRAINLMDNGFQPKLTDAAKLRADIYLANDQLEEGIRQLEIACVNNPSDNESRFRLTKLLLQTGELEGAQKHAKRLLQDNPTSQMCKNLNLEVLEAVSKKRISGNSDKRE